MEVHVLRREQRLREPTERVFEFFADAFNLERITPPWLRFRVLTTAPLEMRPGALIRFRLRLHGVPLRWLARIEEWQPGRAFTDLQVRGPYRYWYHRHDFESDGSGGTLIRDTVRYALPAGSVGELAHRSLVRRDLERIFDFREQAVARILSRG
jgi:ligand-binding SRPBCC domain-containing protein